MRIMVNRKTESVLFTLPAGEEIEITIIQVYGEDSSLRNDIDEAMRILKDDLNYFGTQSLSWEMESTNHSI